MALVQSQQFTGNGLSEALRPLLCLGDAAGAFAFWSRFGRGTRERETMKRMVWALGLMAVAGTFAWGQATAPQPDKDGVYSMGMGLPPAKLIHAAPANCPSDPSLAKKKQVVALRVVIGADGTPGAIEQMNAHPGPFDDAAIAAVKASQFTPAKYKGNPVPTWMMVCVPFLGDPKLAVPMTVSAGEKGVSVPYPVNSVEADFPKSVPKNFAAGVVLIHMLVTDEGLPSEMRVVYPLGHGFDEEALKAAGKYQFAPAKYHGVPVPFYITVEVNFRRY